MSQELMVTKKRRTRPRRTIPPPLPGSPEMLATALFELPASHVWVFLGGKSFRD